MQLTKKRLFFVFAITFYATLFFTFPPIIKAQTVNIPDTNLRTFVTSVLSKPPGTSITTDDMATLTHIETHNAGIRDLTGLEFATKLEEIRLNDSLLSDLSPLSELNRLRVIEFRNNVISDLSPLADLINLEWLIVPNNLIRDLSPVADLVNLHGLDISHNLIIDLSPLSDLMKLNRIWMSENPPADLSPLSGLISLRDFHSWGTPILDITPLADLPKIRVIDICGGEISDLSALANSTGLRELSFAGNEIWDLSPLVNLTGLTHLNLEDNEISDVSPLTGLTNLTFLNLENNDISDFSPLDVFPRRVIIIQQNNPGFVPEAPKIEGPWLWVIAPTDGMSGSEAAASGIDFLAQASRDTVTKLEIATDGATEGDAVGNSVWTVGKLSRRGSNNINDLVNAIALGADDINYHVAYGSVVLEVPSQQRTEMYIGSSDAVKVWLNGVLVHDNPVDRDADDYQENFPVTLKEGTNILLVAIYEGEGWWSGFFGFDAGTKYTLDIPNRSFIVGVPRVTDINSDGTVDILDMILAARDLGRDKYLNPRSDVNGDGRVNILDLTLVARSIDIAAGNAAPSALTLKDNRFPAMVQAWIAQAHIENDGSVVFQQGLANLQRLLASLLPEKTTLLANYPNPFNPETWIPYQIAQASDVQIHIHAINGTLVRTLDLGHRPAGVYQQRTRAAYWDGRNQIGEPVASGVYFYTLSTESTRNSVTAGDFTATRKMLIRK